MRTREGFFMFRIVGNRITITPPSGSGDYVIELDPQ